MGASQLLNKILRVIRKITAFIRNLIGSSKSQPTPVLSTQEKEQTSVPTQKNVQPQSSNNYYG